MAATLWRRVALVLLDQAPPRARPSTCWVRRADAWSIPERRRKPANEEAHKQGMGKEEPGQQEVGQQEVGKQEVGQQEPRKQELSQQDLDQDWTSQQRFARTRRRHYDECNE